ncbi:DNA-binding MarR family transcriptional regulator [Rhizobium ruizarguesonis]
MADSATLRFVTALSEFEKLWPGINVQTASMFMQIAAADLRGSPMSITEASDAAGITLASASRIVQGFEMRRAGRDDEPLHLLEARAHPTQYRAKVVVLTQRGKNLYNRIVQLMGE